MAVDIHGDRRHALAVATAARGLGLTVTPPTVDRTVAEPIEWFRSRTTGG